MKQRPKPLKAQVVSTDVSDAVTAETLDFGNAMMAAIDGVCHQRHEAGQQIDMRAVLGALVSLMAHYIAGIREDEQRMLAYSRCGAELSSMIHTNLELGTFANTFGVPNKKDLQ